MVDEEPPVDEDEDEEEEEPPPPIRIESILTSIKRCLGIAESYIEFDPDLVVYINSAFAILLQLGIGPEDGFSISDGTEVWSDFFVDRVDLEHVKNYVYLRTRLIFDPPQTGYLVDAVKSQLSELEFRLVILETTTETGA